MKIKLNKQTGQINLIKRDVALKLTRTGRRGVKGTDGEGIIAGGTTGQTLAKASNADYDMQWSNSGAGDMIKATYDPTNKSADAFNQDNMSDGATNKNYSVTDKNRLAAITDVDYKNSNTTKADVGLSNVPNTNFTSAVNANTAKVGITPTQSSNITTNNSKVSYTDATKVAGIETGAQKNVQSDWNAGTGDAFIKNKPTIPGAYTLPTASTSVLGGVKVDGSTITIAGDTISSTAVGGVSSVNTKTGAVILNKADIGLGNVTNDAQLKATALDTSGTLTANSDIKIASQKAVKTYVDTGLSTKAVDSNVVHKTGNETITGAKTMSDNFTVNKIMAVDNGSGSAIFTAFLGGFLKLQKASGDAQPALQLYAGNQSIGFGVGGSTAPDTTIKRAGVNQLDFGSAKLQSVADPVIAQDVATKNYVDNNKGDTLPSQTGNTGKYLTTNGSATSWNTVASGSGNVVGPASSTDNAITRYDGTTGKTIQNSGVTIDDSKNLSTTGTVSTSGVTSNAGYVWDTFTPFNDFRGYMRSSASTTSSSTLMSVIMNTNVLTGPYYGGIMALNAQAYVQNGSAAEIIKVVGGQFIAERQAGTSTYLVRMMVGGLFSIQSQTAPTTNAYAGQFTIAGNATNAYSLYVSPITGTHTKQFGLYQEGTSDQNYLGGQTGVGTDTPNASAKVDVTSTTQGMLPPRMTTTQKNAISSPAEGLMVYDLTLHKLCVYTGSAWETVTSV